MTLNEKVNDRLCMMIKLLILKMERVKEWIENDPAVHASTKEALLPSKSKKEGKKGFKELNEL